MAANWWIWIAANYAFWYAIASILPGWRSLAVLALGCIVAFCLCRAEGGGLGYALGLILIFLPAWFGAIGGILVRAVTLWWLPSHPKRLLATLAAAPLAAIVAYFAVGPVIGLM